jgi:hypothetical protein
MVRLTVTGHASVATPQPKLAAGRLGVKIRIEQDCQKEEMVLDHVSLATGSSVSRLGTNARNARIEYGEKRVRTRVPT